MHTVTTARRLQLPQGALRSLLSAVADGRPPGEAVRLLRQAGYDAGDEVFELLQGRIAECSDADGVEAIPMQQFWECFASVWESLRWGTLQHRQIHPAVAELVSTDWIEADAAPAGLGCHFTTGLFADLLRRVAGQEVAVLETECRGRGDRRCRWLLGAPDALDEVYGLLRAGASADDAVARLA
jgi:predicted hydrocarbon binding protein